MSNLAEAAGVLLIGYVAVRVALVVLRLLGF